MGMKGNQWDGKGEMESQRKKVTEKHSYKNGNEDDELKRNLLMFTKDVSYFITKNELLLQRK